MKMRKLLFAGALLSSTVTFFAPHAHADITFNFERPMSRPPDELPVDTGPAPQSEAIFAACMDDNLNNAHMHTFPAAVSCMRNLISDRFNANYAINACVSWYVSIPISDADLERLRPAGMTLADGVVRPHCQREYRAAMTS
jgi:hypothetical protein